MFSSCFDRLRFGTDRFHAPYKVDDMECPQADQNITADPDRLHGHHGKTKAHEQGDRDHNTDALFAKLAQKTLIICHIVMVCFFLGLYNISDSYEVTQFYKQTREDTSVRKQIAALLFSAQQIHGNAAV